MQRLKPRHLPTILICALLWFGSLSLSGCGGDEDGTVAAGDVNIRYDYPEGEMAPEFERDADGSIVSIEKLEFNLAMDGTLVFDKPATDPSIDLDWGDSVTRVLRVDVEGKLWTVGYQALDENGHDITPKVGFKAGQSVHLTLARRQPFGDYYAFSARSENGLLLAINDGMRTDIPADAIEGLKVTLGDKTGATQDDQCGTREAYELVFTAETSANLGAGHIAATTLEDGPAEVMNISAWSYEGAGCTDNGYPNAWMAWRASPL